MHLYIIAMC